MFLRNDHVWYAFVNQCRRHFARMREDDMDYEAMRTVVGLVEMCQRRLLWQFLREYNETYFRETIQTLEERARRSCRLRMQEAFWIGANCGKGELSIPGKYFKWPKYKVRALGIWFSNDPEATATLNYNEKLDKVRNVLSCWKYRRLTLIGKITVVKSLVASQLVYVLSPLHTNAKTIKEVNELFFSFLWNGKGDKIKRDIIINDYPNGGLKMIDIQSFSKSLKATWIKKYLDDENRGKWKYFFDVELDRFGL